MERRKELTGLPNVSANSYSFIDNCVPSLAYLKKNTFLDVREVQVVDNLTQHLKPIRIIESDVLKAIR